MKLEVEVMNIFDVVILLAIALGGVVGLKRGVLKELVVVKRLKCNNCYISASYVREGLKNSDWSIVRKLVPEHVYLYLKQFDNKYDEYAKFN